MSSVRSRKMAVWAAIALSILSGTVIALSATGTVPLWPDLVYERVEAPDPWEGVQDTLALVDLNLTLAKSTRFVLRSDPDAVEIPPDRIRLDRENHTAVVSERLLPGQRVLLVLREWRDGEATARERRILLPNATFWDIEVSDADRGRAGQLMWLAYPTVLVQEVRLTATCPIERAGSEGAHPGYHWTGLDAGSTMRLRISDTLQSERAAGEDCPSATLSVRHHGTIAVQAPRAGS